MASPTGHSSRISFSKIFPSELDTSAAKGISCASCVARSAKSPLRTPSVLRSSIFSSLKSFSTWVIAASSGLSAVGAVSIDVIVFRPVASMGGVSATSSAVSTTF